MIKMAGNVVVGGIRWVMTPAQADKIRRPEPDKPGPGQESVWDYPRPPRLEEFGGTITVELGGRTVASTNRGWRVLETSHPPTYYLPRECFSAGVLRPASGSSWCEWKGQASYFDLLGGTTVAIRPPGRIHIRPPASNRSPVASR